MLQTPLSPAGAQLFGGVPGLGDMLSQQVGETADEIRKRRLAELAGRPDLAAGFGGRAGLPSPISSMLGFGLR
jgi:hypothetical protein